MKGNTKACLFVVFIISFFSIVLPQYYSDDINELPELLHDDVALVPEFLRESRKKRQLIQ